VASSSSGRRLTPRNASLEPAHVQKFLAEVDGSLNKSVVWSLTGPGSIENGIYLAPSTIAGRENVTVKATSQADPYKFAIAWISLVPKSLTDDTGGSKTPDGACFYSDKYQGWQQCYHAGEQIADLGKLRNNVSSIRIFGGVTVAVYENRNFEDRTVEFTSDVPDLGLRVMTGNRLWNDQIESVRVFPRAGVCVFERAGFQGRSECWVPGQDQPDLGRSSKWRSQISSIRAFGRVVISVYNAGNFQGESFTLDGDIPDLARIRRGSGNWHHQISSLRVR
jgi:Beta/Gamma crystallin